MKPTRYISVFLLSILLYSCSSTSSTEETTRSWWFDSYITNTGKPLPKISSTSPIKLSLSLSDDTLSMNESLEMTLEVSNTTEDSLKFLVGGSGNTTYYDFVVIREDSSLLWNRVDPPISLAQHGYMLTPNETKTFKHTWNLEVETGSQIKKGNYYVFGGFADMQYFSTTSNPIEEMDLGPVSTNVQKIIVK